MIKIKPINIGYPIQIVDTINIRLMPFLTTDKSCEVFYQLLNITPKIDNEGNTINEEKCLGEGVIQIKEEQFAQWGSDNSFIEDIVLSELNLEREVIINTNIDGQTQE